MAFRPISRRAALKSLGVTIALPYLEAMAPTSRAAVAAATAPPRRLVFVYFPNGVKTEYWKSKGEGADFELGPTLKAFEPFKSNMLVFSNLADANARGGGAHASTMPAYLSGKSIFKTMGNDIRAGVTCDQVVAKKIGNATRFPSLELGCDFGQQDGFCDTGYSCVYQTNISWRSRDDACCEGSESARGFRSAVRRRIGHGNIDRAATARGDEPEHTRSGS